MSITPLTIYLWQLADNLGGATLFVTLFSGVAALVCFGMFFFEGEDTKKLSAILGSICFLSAVFFTFLPSSRTIAMMVIIPKIADSEAVKRDIPDLYDAAIKALKNNLTK